MAKSAQRRSDQELRAIALRVHAGVIVTNAEVQEHRWSLYALSRPPLQIEFQRLTRADVAKLKKFTKEIAAWETGARPQIGRKVRRA